MTHEAKSKIKSVCSDPNQTSYLCFNFENISCLGYLDVEDIVQFDHDEQGGIRSFLHYWRVF